MVPTLLPLFLVGCAARQPTVPSDYLTDLPPETVGLVARLNESADELDREIAQAEIRRERAVADEAAARARIQAIEEAVQADRKLRRLAVERGDVEAVAAADAVLDQRFQIWSQVTDEHTRLEHAAALASAELELLRREEALVAAQVQLVTAGGVATRHELGLGKFERAVHKAARARDEARAEVERLRREEAPKEAPTT